MSYDAYHPNTTETVLSLPLNGSIFTTRRKVSSEKATPVLGASAATELGPVWADSVIVGASVVPDSSHETQNIIHARIPSEEAQLATNWEYSTCSLGGQRYPSIQRTVILPASAVARDTPARGSAMPTEAGSIFAGQSYILVDRAVARSGMQLEPHFRVERRNYVQRSTMRNLGVDSLNGKTLSARSDLRHALEVIDAGRTMQALAELPNDPYWGIQADGTQRTYNQLSCGWYSVETSQIVGGTYALGVVDCGRYFSNDPFYWPPVLETYEILAWERKEGGTDQFPALRFHPDGYNGPCKTEIIRTWSKTEFVIPVAEQMQPTRIYYSSPYSTANISECLHPAVSFRSDIGSGDPVYVATVGTARHFAATNYTTWPATILAYDDQQPFRGGYLRTQRRVHRPVIPPNVNWTTGATIV